MRRWTWRALLAALLAVWLVALFWQYRARMPPGTHVAGAWSPILATDVQFLYDRTAADGNGQLLIDQQIQARMLAMIAAAREFILIDAGLFGDLPAIGPDAARLRAVTPLAANLVQALLRRRREQPSLQILLLIDPSTLLFPAGAAQVAQLRDGGIDVVSVDVNRLRSPDAIFATSWRLCCAWWNRHVGPGSWPNPAGVGSRGVSIAAWAQLHGFQRSHRQFLIADHDAVGLDGMILSRPLHAEAGMQSATALGIQGPALAPLLEAEFVVAQFSGWADRRNVQAQARHLLQSRAQQLTLLRPAVARALAARARIVTERAVGQVLIARVDATVPGDSIDIAALYLSERGLVDALIDAGHRGVSVRVLLDPGKDGYGFARSGLPNRQVASELVAGSDGVVRVRWYRTHGERFSPSFVMIRTTDRTWLLNGSAQLRRNDLDDYNLAAAFIVDLPSSADAAMDAITWFDTLWYNRAAGGTEYTVDADAYADPSQLHYWQYRLLEAIGASY